MAYELFYKYLYPIFKDSDLSFLRLFQYITFRSAYAVITAVAISFIFGPYLIRYLKSKKLNQPIRNDGPETHLNKSGTPTMGGILIIGSIIISTLFWGRLDYSYVWLIIFTTLTFGLIGFVDDYKKLILKSPKGLSGRKKLFWQLLISTFIVFIISQINYSEQLANLPPDLKYYMKNVGNLPQDLLNFYLDDQNVLPLYIPFVDKPLFDISFFSFSFTLPFLNAPIFVPYVYIIFGVFVIVGSSNAVNLTDGLDGLAIGLLILVGISFAVLSYISGNSNITQYLNIAFVKQAGELTVFCAAFIGAGMGFLWYNSHPAQVFMGDTGSLALGGAIGVMALMIKKEVLLIIVGGVFVLEAISVILQVLYYKWTKKRIFKMAPIHHHYELSGWHESKIIIRFWIIGVALALFALSTLKIQ
ncbi:MAG: phospho-N-acetylmuramoyl-pentapeptide-transferase [Spirochaetota bacterium]|nr:phospho-N-acetylmuramoyl-pentapeptide-transferase [Spirochaetota bacterium]